ncbi:hypothetical protein [Anoxybacillus sp. J5B_2022]|uniref:hypothetical protein n=1 Tax=Anoxybacillus sp. J5B_2022 TaxID=3003246 RepID=UPI002285DA5E|nr:hypothetical protein [Anoxybacillus sp. J5B_2022]MCZ0754281.1 hypothetical protein [Anoxybacillus sp. J5B_2022]
MRKRRFVWFFVYLGAIVALVSSPYWLWQLKPAKQLNLLVIDKTVPDNSYREHKGLMWILNQQKYVKPDGTKYDLKWDYIGFVPKQGTYDVKHLPRSLARYDAVYVTDTYGVYEEEFLKKSKTGRRSAKVYGGMTEDDVQALRKMVMRDRKVLIAEFNSFAHPTSESVRKQFYALLNLEWTGWIGRYFPDLQSSEVPVWVKENYKQQYGRPFRFQGPGYVLVDENDRLVVMDKREIGKKGVVFSYTKAGEKKWGESGSVPYSYWFDIVKPLDENEVLATYTLSLSKRGKETLRALGLPSTFPAVVHHVNRLYESYYFCGDYADEADVPNIYQTVGFNTWRKWTTSNSPDNTSVFYWKAYVPMMTHVLQEIEQRNVKPLQTVQIYKKNSIRLAGTVGNDYIQIYKNGKWKNILIKGVNMGISKPGAFPGETAITKEEYFRWFKQIGAMNANAVRVYTIHPPAFYEALYEYNQIAARPLYLFHGVWVNEETFLRTNDAFAKENTDEFWAEIKRTIDIVHGKANLPKRLGHASGTYRYDISPYVLGWIFGVEWDPTVVLATNEKHKGLPDYRGTYIYTEKAQPFEVWLARMLDEAIAYETKTYHWQRPVSFTNWVTTDLLKHPSEPLKKEDMVSVNPNVMKSTDKLYTGLFASYHIYPYYPDFLNYEKKYVNYIDHRGQKNNYAGYLRDMKKAHHMPILVAEFGVPSSRGMTHRNVYGMNQGFHSEKEQGEIDRKLFEDIVHEKMAGGLVFTWQDEWFKRTWNTMDYDNPNRRPFWSNAQTNEQQFGLLSFDPGKSETDMIKVDGRAEDWEFKRVKPAFQENNHAMYVTSDERYLYLRIDTNRITKNKETYVLFNTIKNQGQSRILHIPGVKTSDVDFVLAIKGTNKARLWVDSYYDTFYYHYGYLLHMIPQVPYANKKDNGVYHPILLTLNKELDIRGTKIPFQSYETGIFRFGTANPNDAAYNSLTDISVSADRTMYEIRIPWLLLNIKDPSMREVMGDVWSKNGLASSEHIDGIRIGLYETDGKTTFAYPALNNAVLPAEQFYRYEWRTWEEPNYHERLKQSYEEMKKIFSREGEEK